MRRAIISGGILVFRQVFQGASPRVPAVLAFVISVALLVWVIGYWGVRFVTPTGAARPALALPAPAAAAQAISTRHLFGLADGESAPAAGSGSVRVLGVAATGGSGGAFAIVSVDGKAPVPAFEGQEFGSGLRLTRVTPAGIEYQRGGTTQRALLPENRSGSSLPPPLAPTAGSDLPAPAPSVNVPVTPAPAS